MRTGMPLATGTAPAPPLVSRSLARRPAWVSAICVAALSATLSVALCWSGMAEASPALGKLRYLSEEYPPYNFTNDAGKASGLAVELLQLVWQQTQTPAQAIAILPWARGYYLLAQQPDVVLFSTARTEARSPLFKWACPIGDAQIVLMGLAGQNIRLRRLIDAERYRIGAVQRDVGEQLLLSGGIDEQRIRATDNLPQALGLLTAGRVDLISGNERTLQALIKSRRLEPARFKVAWVLSSEQFCFAFSHAIDDALVEEFRHGLTRVLAGSDFLRLQAKYLPAP